MKEKGDEKLWGSESFLKRINGERFRGRRGHERDGGEEERSFTLFV